MNSIWHQNPFTRIAIAFILGLLLARYVEPILVGELWVGAVFFMLFIAIWLARKSWRSYKLRYTFGVLISIVFVLAGYTRYSQYGRQNQLHQLPQQSLVWTGSVQEYPIFTAKSIKLELQLYGYNTDGEIKRVESKVLAYANQNSGFDTLAIGDRIVFEGAIRPFDAPINPGQFDYGAYLKSHGVTGMVFLNTDNATANRPTDIPFNIVQQFKKVQHELVGVFARYGMPQKELGVASALVLGYRANIDPTVKQGYVDAGVVHILAVSGLHVGIIYLIFQWLLSLVFRNNKWSKLQLVILLFLLWGYAGITGLSPSVLRATTMFSFLAIGKQFQQYGSIYNMLGVSAVVLLLFNPSLLFEVGFQLSYIAVIGIALFFKPIHNLWFIENSFLDKVWSLAAVSIAAQISTFPLAIYYFHQFPMYFLVSNVAIITLATISLYAGLAALAFSWIPGVDWFLLKVVQYLFFSLNYIVEWIAHLPNAKIEFLFIRPFTVVCLYLLIAFLFKFFQSPSKWKVWWPMSFLVVLTVLYAERKISIYNTSEVAILQGSEKPIALLQYGSTAWVKTDKAPIEFLKTEQFYIDGYRTLKGISQLNVLGLSDTLILGDVKWMGDTLTVYAGEEEVFAMEHTDQLIFAHENMVIDTSVNALYVLNPALSEYKKSKVLSRITDVNKTPYDLASQGVLILQLD